MAITKMEQVMLNNWLRQAGQEIDVLLMSLCDCIIGG